MTELPEPTFTNEHRVELYSNLLINDLQKSVAIYIVKESLASSFYNFSDFFLKQKIVDDEVKQCLKQKIVKILQDKGYKLAYAFNKTGLIIARDVEERSKSVWRTNLDYKEI
tara:strand:- start:79 stop:414 length:336 start_codon:yes stop_codon:yes gene_type:complete